MAELECELQTGPDINKLGPADSVVFFFMTALMIKDKQAMVCLLWKHFFLALYRKPQAMTKTVSSRFPGLNNT